MARRPSRWARARPGCYAGTFTILPFNRAVVFEAGREGESRLSRTVSLVDLGVDPDLLQTTFTPPGSSAETRSWGWLALAAAALAGAALLGYFVWPKEPKVGNRPPPTADRGPGRHNRHGNRHRRDRRVVASPP